MFKERSKAQKPYTFSNFGLRINNLRKFSDRNGDILFSAKKFLFFVLICAFQKVQGHCSWPQDDLPLLCGTFFLLLLFQAQQRVSLLIYIYYILQIHKAWTLADSVRKYRKFSNDVSSTAISRNSWTFLLQVFGMIHKLLHYLQLCTCAWKPPTYTIRIVNFVF